MILSPSTTSFCRPKATNQRRIKRNSLNQLLKLSPTTSTSTSKAANIHNQVLVISSNKPLLTNNKQFQSSNPKQASSSRRIKSHRNVLQRELGWIRLIQRLNRKRIRGKGNHHRSPKPPNQSKEPSARKMQRCLSRLRQLDAPWVTSKDPRTLPKDLEILRCSTTSRPQAN